MGFDQSILVWGAVGVNPQATVGRIDSLCLVLCTQELHQWKYTDVDGPMGFSKRNVCFLYGYRNRGRSMFCREDKYPLRCGVDDTIGLASCIFHR